MNRPPQHTAAAAPNSDRVFLVLVDGSEEMHQALRYACLRARHSHGRVALLYVQEPTEFTHWLGVDAIMREESRELGENTVRDLADHVARLSGSAPLVHIREGDRAEELFTLVAEDPAICLVVLGARAGGGKANPIIASLTGKELNRLRVPFTIVPGSLTDDQIDAMT